MYSLFPEKTLRLKYEPFYLAISIVEFAIFYEIITSLLGYILFFSWLAAVSIGSQVGPNGGA